MQVEVREAKERLSELIRLANSGEDVVIADRGRALVRLLPVATVAEIRTPVPSAPNARDEEGGNVDAILAVIQKPRPAWMQRTDAEIDADIAAIRDGWD